MAIMHKVSQNDGIVLNGLIVKNPVPLCRNLEYILLVYLRFFFPSMMPRSVFHIIQHAHVLVGVNLKSSS